VTKLRFAFSGDPTVYEVNSPAGSSAAILNFTRWGGTTTAAISNNGATRTWTIANNLVDPGSRTVIVTGYNASGKASATKSFVLTVTPPMPVISAVTPSPTSGTTLTGFKYTVITGTDVTKLRFAFSGNPTVYEVNSAGVLNFPRWGGTTTATVTNSGSNRTWTIANDLVDPGSHIVTVTAYNFYGTTSKSFVLTVTKPIPVITSVTPSPASGTEATKSFTLTGK